EAANRMSCTNNMKQLALGCHNYNDTTGSLPPAVWVNVNNVGWHDENNIGPNWLVMILPYCEQNNLYKQYSTTIQNYQNWALPTGTTGSNDQGWRGMRNQTIKTYLCPSESFKSTLGNRAGGNWARGNYAANDGPGDPNTAKNGGSPTYTTASSSSGAITING